MVGNSQASQIHVRMEKLRQVKIFVKDYMVTGRMRKATGVSKQGPGIRAVGFKSWL